MVVCVVHQRNLDVILGGGSGGGGPVGSRVGPTTDVLDPRGGGSSGGGPRGGQFTLTLDVNAGGVDDGGLNVGC